MTQYKHIVEARALLNIKEKDEARVVSLSHTFGEDHWVHILSGGRQIKVFEDRRKKDEVIYKGIK